MKVEGSNITINDSVYNKLTIIPEGACEQDGTPTPDTPIPVKVVTGNNSVLVQNENLVVYNETQVTLVKSTNRTISITPSNFPLTLPAGTYTFYLPDLVLTNLSYRFRCTIFGNSYDIINKFCTFTLTVPTKALSLYIFISNSDNSNATATFSKLMILKGSYTAETLPDYVKGQQQTATLHLGTQYLAGIGDYRDQPVGDKDNWKIKRYVKKLSLPNNKGDYNSGNNWYYIAVTDLGLTSPYNLSLLAKYFTFYDIATFTASNSLNGISISSGGSYILIRNTDCTSQAEYRTWLTNNDNLIYLQAQEPIEIPVTDSTLITELNNLQDMLSYDGITNITITSAEDNAQMIAEVTYTSESDMCEKLLFIFNKMKDKLYHIIRSL